MRGCSLVMRRSGVQIPEAAPLRTRETSLTGVSRLCLSGSFLAASALWAAFGWAGWFAGGLAGGVARALPSGRVDPFLLPPSHPHAIGKPTCRPDLGDPALPRDRPMGLACQHCFDDDPG